MFAAAVTDSYPESELSTPPPLTFFLYIGHTFFSREFPIVCSESETEMLCFFYTRRKHIFSV
jgi:hypothetical protein